MKKTRTGKTLLILAVVAVLGIGSYAYADWGMGYGRHMGYGWGSGYGPGMMGPGAYDGYGMGPGMMGYRGDSNWGALSKEDATKIEKEQTAFLKATEKLRQDLYAKGLELRSEFAKETPDAAKAANLQKELSELEGQLDQKRVDHMITLRKITPNVGMSFAGRGMMNEGLGDNAPCWR